MGSEHITLPCLLSLGKDFYVLGCAIIFSLVSGRWVCVSAVPYRSDRVLFVVLSARRGGFAWWSFCWKVGEEVRKEEEILLFGRGGMVVV